jgi:uncharacterized protein
MKFHLSLGEGHRVTGTGAGWVRVDANEHRASFLLAPDTLVTPWASGGFEGLGDDDFAPVVALQPEIVLLGTGRTQRFPHPRLSAALAAAHVGLEVMDTKAACRTYNILVAEARRVALALVFE